MEFKANRKTDNIENTLFFSRYLTTQKLLHLLLNRQIPFTRLDKFDDMLEGMTYKNLALLTASMRSEEENNPLIQEDLDSFKMNSETAIKRIESETLSLQKGQYVSCWFCDERESMAMWDLYSSIDGIMIKIEAKKLFNFMEKFVLSLDDDNYLEFLYGFCDYRQLMPFDYTQGSSNHTYNALKKDLCYKHENEFRFIGIRKSSKKDEKLYSYNVNVESIINDFQIIFHPRMESWKKENLEKLIEKLGLSIKVQDSIIRTR
jgi:hypothetical protein